MTWPGGSGSGSQGMLEGSSAAERRQSTKDHLHNCHQEGPSKVWIHIAVLSNLASFQLIRLHVYKNVQGELSCFLVGLMTRFPGKKKTCVVGRNNIESAVEPLIHFLFYYNLKFYSSFPPSQNRFFLKCEGSFVNPEPGTVVDTTVTRPEYQDYFLIAQSTNQGTISPTHYNVIHDQSEYNLSIHQSLAFKLCHLYYNWQGTVKVPAPCQYAHKLAYQVGENLGHSPPHPQLALKMHYLWGQRSCLYSILNSAAENPMRVPCF